MESRPNILFVLSDQQRWDTCGCYGQPLNITPHLDQMATDGTKFEFAFTPQPVCGPARSCIQTGKYATGTGCVTNDVALRLDETTIAHHLSDTGYDVGYIGKWHLASNYATDWFPVPPGERRFDYSRTAIPPERRGGYKDFWLASDLLEYTSHSYDGFMFDGQGRRRDFPSGRYRADAMTDWVLEYLQTRDNDNPFFLFVSYIEPHQQNDHRHFEGPLGSKERFRHFHVPGDLEGMEGDWQEEYPDYLGCVNRLDANIGRMRAAIERMGIADNTLIIYTSDHGCHFRTRNKDYKRSCHESSIRVPLLIFGPGFTGGNQVEALVSLIDLPPTLLAAAGVNPPPTMKGRPLQHLLTGNGAAWPQEVFIQISESQCGRAIRTKKWKYSVRALEGEGWEHSSDRYTEDFLYDLALDPYERNNLVDSPDHAQVRSRLAQKLRQHMIQAGEKPAMIVSR